MVDGAGYSENIGYGLERVLNLMHAITDRSLLRIRRRNRFGAKAIRGLVGRLVGQLGTLRDAVTFSATVVDSTPEALGEHVKTEIANWTPVVKEAGVQVA